MPEADIYQERWQSALAQARGKASESGKQSERGKGYKIVEIGWEQHVLIDESAGIVYRYPRHAAAAAKLADEVKVLADIHRRRWPVKLPVMLEYNEVFASYEYIPGEVLTAATVSSLKAEDFERIGRRLGEFLALFHQLDFSIVAQKQTSHSTSLLQYYSRRINNSSSARFKEKAVPELAALSEQAVQTGQISRVVVHGDLHGPNVVIDPRSRQLAGVIDLSEMEIGDPHQDFRKLFMTDPRLLGPAVTAYGQNGGRALDEELARLWAYVNEWANLCYFAGQPDNFTYQRAQRHLQLWDKL